MSTIPSIGKHTPGLPTDCPRWCVGTHEQALDEGCTVEESRVHASEGVGDRLADLVNHRAQRLDRPGGGGWRVQLYADPGADLVWTGLPLIHLEGHTWTEADESQLVKHELTSGEARVLARQLLHYADEADLPDLR